MRYKPFLIALLLLLPLVGYGCTDGSPDDPSDTQGVADTASDPTPGSSDFRDVREVALEWMSSGTEGQAEGFNVQYSGALSHVAYTRPTTSYQKAGVYLLGDATYVMDHMTLEWRRFDAEHPPPADNYYPWMLDLAHLWNPRRILQADLEESPDDPQFRFDPFDETETVTVSGTIERERLRPPWLEKVVRQANARHMAEVPLPDVLEYELTVAPDGSVTSFQASLVGPFDTWNLLENPLTLPAEAAQVSGG